MIRAVPPLGVVAILRGGGVDMRKFLKRARAGAVSGAVLVSSMAFAGGSSDPFAGTELAGAEGVVTGFLAVGAAITIALVVYRLGKRAINRV